MTASDPTGWGLHPTRLPSPHHFRPRLSPVLLSGCRLQIPKTSSLDSINLREWCTVRRETFYLVHHQFSMKGYNLGTNRWKGCIGPSGGTGPTKLPCPLQARHCSQISMSSSTWKLPRPPSFWVFMEASWQRPNWWNNWLLMTGLNLQQFFPLRYLGVRLKFPTL